MATAAHANLRYRRAAAFAAIYLLWGATSLAIRWGVESIPPFVLVGSRFLLAGAPLYVVLRARGARRPDLRTWLVSAAVGGFMMLGGNGLMSFAQRSAPSSAAAMLLPTIPLWTVVIERLVTPGARLGIRRVAGVVLGAAGVALLVRPGGSALHGIGAASAAALLLAPLLWSVGTVAARRLRQPDSPLLAAAMQMTAGGALALAVGAASGDFDRLHVAAVGARALASFAYLVVFGSIVGLTAFLWIVKTMGAGTAATHAFVNPVVAVALGVAVGGERIAPPALVGMPLLLVAAALVVGVPATRAVAARISAPDRRRVDVDAVVRDALAA